MKRKRLLLLGACTLALLQWGCMDYKEFSDIGVEPFRPDLVVPVAADTAYVTDVSKLDSGETHVRFDPDGGVSMYYMTKDVVEIEYKLQTPNLLGKMVNLTKGENLVKDAFKLDYNVGALKFSAGHVTLKGATQNITIGGLELTPEVAADLTGKTLVFDQSTTDTRKGDYSITVPEDCSLLFDGMAQVSEVGLGAKQEGAKLFSVNHGLGSAVIDLFSSNFYANQDFAEANFTIKVTPVGENVKKLPLRFTLCGVAACYERVKPDYDGTQIPVRVKDRQLENKANPGDNAIPFSSISTGGTGAADHWSYFMPNATGENAPHVYIADDSNSNLIDVLKDGPQSVDFGKVEAQFGAKESDWDKGPFMIRIDQLKQTEKLEMEYEFNLPLRGKEITSLWVNDIMLEEKLPNLGKSDEFSEANKYLELKDDDMVKLYIQFTNRIPLDVYASVEFRRLVVTGETDLKVRDSMRLNFNNIVKMPTLSKDYFTNNDFEMFKAANSAPKAEDGTATGESKNLVTCEIPYSKYKMIRRNAEMIRISYCLRSETGEKFKLKKDDYVYVRIGVEAKPTISYNLGSKK